MTPFSLAAWALRHHVSVEALAELRLGLAPTEPDVTAAALTGGPQSEAYVQSRVRLEAARAGIHAWRNNVGALPGPSGGRPVRFGLANDSAAMNEVVKSADLLGIKPVLITPAHVGFVIGQFWSRECKQAGWVFSGTPREIAQERWGALVLSAGGDAAFTTGVGSL